VRVFLLSIKTFYAEFIRNIYETYDAYLMYHIIRGNSPAQRLSGIIVGRVNASRGRALRYIPLADRLRTVGE